MSKSLWVVAAFIFLSSGWVWGADETTNGPVSKAGDAVQITGAPGSPEQITQLVKKLGLMVPLSQDVGGYAEIPNTVYPYLLDLRHGLVTLALDTLNGPGQKKFKPADCGDVIKGILEKAGLDCDMKLFKKGDVVPFGWMTKYAFGPIEGFPDLLVMHTGLTVTCGQDESLYLIQRIDGVWKLILAYEGSPGSDKSYVAQENLQYLILPVNGKPTLVVTNTPVWCQSCWFDTPLAVLQPGDDPFKPKALWSDERQASRCLDMDLEKTSNGFIFKYTGQGDELGFFKDVTEEYAFTSDGVKRLSVKKTDHE